jgi:hypothetical protein
MKIIVHYDRKSFPPVLSLVIYDAPHRRMHRRMIQQYREFLRDACSKAKIATPIDEPIDLQVNFVNPSSPDMGNTYIALEQAMDGKALKGPGILTDDSLVQKVVMSKFYNQPRKK